MASFVLKGMQEAKVKACQMDPYGFTFMIVSEKQEVKEQSTFTSSRFSMHQVKKVIVGGMFISVGFRWMNK